MQITRCFSFTVFLRKNLFFLLLLPFFIMVCAEGESLESEPFFNFIRAIDPQNVLNISWISNGSASSNPCKLKLNGVRCNSKDINIIEIRLERLNLSGTIDADSLCRLKKMRTLSLAENSIRGNIPNSIFHCTMLSYLNLTSNQLSGRIPRGLMKLKFLRKLDISNNKFSGVIQNQQEHRSESDNNNNNMNTRVVLLEDDKLSPTANPLPTSSNTRSGFKITLPLLLGFGLLLLLLSLFLVGRKLGKLSAKSGNALKNHTESQMRKAPNEVTEQEEDEKLKERDTELVFFVEEHERFTLEDLLQATADLRSESFCSSLYKVKLKNDVHYAVKRLKNLQVSSDDFSKTLRQISNFKHPNILPLVGYRSTSEEKLIIYKYQSNGSLLNLFEDYLGGKKDFPWKLRLRIAYGIARGLAFIYQKVDEWEIIPHGNLKLSNILLNDNNEPLISEHGLLKFLDPNRGFLFSAHAYTAPEKSLTEKGDVYSFGVILLELLTGKSIEVTRIDLTRWVRSMVSEEWTGEVFDKEVREAEYQWAFPVLNIAFMCVSRLPENRPTMEEILEKIQEVMNEREQLDRVNQRCCDGSNTENCCSLHKIIPETWDSPGSNY
ncbi:putative inactive receptor kinase [Senna tora]|uniref:Putative inactive receptor kinase n=1 Tax=Senna tora TaxID=362788 RepID=A0A834T8C1_9FABA|nr:putative inactive receptor kinase [Senna tora]